LSPRLIRRIKLIVYILYTMTEEKQVTFLIPQAGESTGYIRV
jgi:hypothetical protein